MVNIMCKYVSHMFPIISIHPLTLLSQNGLQKGDPKFSVGVREAKVGRKSRAKLNVFAQVLLPLLVNKDFLFGVTYGRTKPFRIVQSTTKQSYSDLLRKTNPKEP